MKPRPDPLTLAGLAMAAAGIVWLAPLILDQLVFFGDRVQAADAAAARAVMPWPSLLLGVGAGLIGVRGHGVHATLAGLPLLAVLLAWATPDAGYQMLAFALSAPVALVALVAVALRLPRMHER